MGSEGLAPARSRRPGQRARPGRPRAKAGTARPQGSACKESFSSFETMCVIGSALPQPGRHSPAPVERTYEPRQTSRGGLVGSGGSGWTLLTVREEARSRSGRLGELDPGRVKGREHGRQRGHLRCERTQARARTATVRCRVVVTGVSVIMADGRVTGFHRLAMGSGVSMPMDGVHGVMPGCFAASHLMLHTCRPDRAQHGSRHRTPDREQEG